MSVSDLTSNIKITPSWLKYLESEFKSDYMTNLKSFLQAEIKKNKTIFPNGPNYFEALNRTDFDKVKVVILGQDPYHGEGQAHGLSFSVPKGVRPPPSLLNIFKEIRTDLNKEPSVKDDLSSWADQGVLLLNSVLTVEMGKPASHQGRGWETFTDKIIHALNDQREGLVFILWGAYAQKKGAFIDRSKHFVIESVHPSPLSAHRGFMGSKPFSKANAYLKKNGKSEINW
ncbi:MAG: uracil-DNA glycosylase [Bdellovibrio sp. 28-41-41]|nr:MAG: uracil-DNA glycosylase [Bdellovibrio sp. 28-41-41]